MHQTLFLTNQKIDLLSSKQNSAAIPWGSPVAQNISCHATSTSTNLELGISERDGYFEIATIYSEAKSGCAHQSISGGDV